MAERTYMVIPAAVIREHARQVTASERWRAWTAARSEHPELADEACVVIPETQFQELGGELWLKGHTHTSASEAGRATASDGAVGVVACSEPPVPSGKTSELVALPQGGVRG